MVGPQTITTRKVTSGVFFVEIPAAGLRLLCGCPPDVIKHLRLGGFIEPVSLGGVASETGPNAILISDLSIQNESFATMAEFPVLQMLYRQGMLIPGHPNNTGRKPLLIGDSHQLRAQLDYIHRGNYGLLTREELLHAGASAKDAEALMFIKQKFAFDDIKTSEDLLDTVTLDSNEALLAGDVRLTRLDVNRFQISHANETTIIDLNLQPGEVYRSPVKMPFVRVNRQDFAVIHTGEGDGWDPHRPAMASIVMHQGSIYLIDAGPAVAQTLKALGIGLSEVRGVFHTHSHDDHFAGLTDLMRTERKLRYFAAPVVRASVTKKLSALLSIPDTEMAHFFDFHDLEVGQWNDVDGLKVKPMFSPHPVETTIFQFRAKGPSGEKTYTHLADIASAGVLDGFLSMKAITPSAAAMIKEAKKIYDEPVNLKKIDIGGGMIHGEAADFRNDGSEKIILAHTSAELTEDEQKIGERAQFADLDLVITATKDYAREMAATLLDTQFPVLTSAARQTLLGCPIQHFEPGSAVFSRANSGQTLYLVLHGYVERTYQNFDLTGDAAPELLGSGCLLGALSPTQGESSAHYRALSHVTALEIAPKYLLDQAAKDAAGTPLTSELLTYCHYLQNHGLFSEGLTQTTLWRFARLIGVQHAASGQTLDLANPDRIYVLKDGEAHYFLNSSLRQVLHAGSFFGAEGLFGQAHETRSVTFISDAKLFTLPAAEVSRIPVCRLKLLEMSRRRELGR